MAERPLNHTQKVLAARRKGTPIEMDWPEISLELVVKLEDEFPQACMQPGDDPIEHMHYAGAAQVAITLRGIYEAQQEEHREARHMDDASQDANPSIEMELP